MVSAIPDKVMTDVISGAFYKMWIMTSGIYMTAARCPCCGGQICPVGLGAGLLIGGGIAGMVHGAGVLKKKVVSLSARQSEKALP